MDKQLTNKEKLFVAEYAIDMDVKRAAVAAGFSKTMASTKAYQWVSDSKVKPHVFNAIKKALLKKIGRAERSADEVIERLWDFSDLDNEEYDGKRVCNTKSTELLAKHYKLITDKLEHTGKDGRSLFPELSDADLDARIAAIMDGK